MRSIAQISQSSASQCLFFPP